MSKRRLAVILFADIAGYTARMQQDESLAKGQLQAFREAMQNQVAAHQGEIVHFYGDGCLVLFSLPQDAAQAAIALQEIFQEKEVPVRIGIHSGTVNVDEDHVYGDAINVASRVESMSVPGAVLLSKKVRDELKNQPVFQLQSLGSFAFKNVEEPMEVYALANEGLSVPRAADMKGKGQEVSAKESNRTQRLIRAMSLGFIGIFLGLTIWMGISWKQASMLEEDTAQIPDKTIAVLPLRNDSGEAKNDYFCNGITDDILFQLQKIKDLKVVSNPGNFAAQQASFSQLGQDLDVSYLLTGSVRKSEKEVIVTTRLIKVSDESQVWVDRYEKNLSLESVFNIQADVAQKVAKSLQSEMNRPTTENPSQLPTQNLQAYEYYLKGNEHFKFITANDKSAFQKALDQYQKAIELDPDFSLALIQMAKSYEMMYWWHLDQDEATKDKAGQYLQKALALEPDLPEALLLQASLLYHFDRNYSAALAILESLKSRIPNNPLLYITAGAIYKRTGRIEAALNANKRAFELSPFNPDYMREYLEISIRAKKYDQAKQLISRIIKVDPDENDAYLWQARLKMMQEWAPKDGMDQLRESVQVRTGGFYLGYVELAIASQDYEAAVSMLEEISTSLLVSNRNSYIPTDLLRAWVAWYQDKPSLSRRYASQAEAVLLLAMEKYPEDKRLYMSLGECYALMGEEKKALKIIESSWEKRSFQEDTWEGTLLEQAHMNVLIILGEYEKALVKGEFLLSIPSVLTEIQWTRHPLYKPLRELAL
ncbi:MAG: adenylate/guanylate cyclase domain-containing protein [Bacteroidota bacterium]